MESQKCQTLYREFQELLKEKGFDWVVAQVEDQVRLGKTIPQEVDTVQTASQELGMNFGAGASSGRRRKSKSKDTFLKRVDYTPHERLLLIIVAVEHAVVDVGEIGTHLAQFLHHGGTSASEITIASEEENVPAKNYPLNESLTRTGATEKLRNLLAELKKEVIKDAR